MSSPARRFPNGSNSLHHQIAYRPYSKGELSCRSRFKALFCKGKTDRRLCGRHLSAKANECQRFQASSQSGISFPAKQSISGLVLLSASEISSGTPLCRCCNGSTFSKGDVQDLCADPNFWGAQNITSEVLQLAA